jgi:hypothetical protein
MRPFCLCGSEAARVLRPPVEDRSVGSVRVGTLGVVAISSGEPDASSGPSTVPGDGTAVPDDRAWRLEVGRFRAGCAQRTFPLAVHVGVPAGPRRSFEVPWPVPEGYDVGLRLDLLLGLVGSWSRDGSGSGCAWLTRQGVPVLHDQDTLWHAAAVRAFGALTVDLVAFRVVTKTGWLDVRTGESRTWRRLRL